MSLRCSTLHTLGDGDAARTVLKWLRESGSLLEDSDDRLVVRRLAAAGQAGRRVETPLTDQQVLAMRAAFERMDVAELQELAPHVGSAVSLQAFEHEAKGRRKRRKITVAHPVDAYLPRTVDRETDSFAVAAEQSLRIPWLSGHYARILRSPSGREGIGAQRFLRLLGAETAPRLRLHPQLVQRYNSDQRPRFGQMDFRRPLRPQPSVGRSPRYLYPSRLRLPHLGCGDSRHLALAR